MENSIFLSSKKSEKGEREVLSSTARLMNLFGLSK